MKGSALAWVAGWARRFSALCLLAAGVGAVIRQPELNLFNDADEAAGLIRLLGAAIAIGAGVVSLTTWRKGAEVAPFVFLNFLFAATIFDVVVKHTLFAKVLVGVLLVAITLEQVRRSWGSVAPLPAEPRTDGGK